MTKRLSLLYFLQFGVWGCYLTSLGQFLGAGGLGADIAWFYAAIGIVSIVTPPLFGRLADKSLSPHRLLGLVHISAAIFMILFWVYASSRQKLDFAPSYLLYVGFLAFYMPTMALSNTVSFRLLEGNGLNSVTTFPRIRIWGTVGFVAAMWFVNSAYWENGGLHFTLQESSDPAHLRFQYNAMQLLCSGLLGVVTGLYAFTLPRPTKESLPTDSAAKPKIGMLKAAKQMWAIPGMRLFLTFVVLSGVCLQISNGFATPYITQFLADPLYADALAAGNATLLFSLSQISEALCILLVGLSLRYKGIRWVYAIGLLAWALRFLMLGLGNPGGGLWLLVGSMIIYGIAFNFITIAGNLHIQQTAPPRMKGFAQGIMMLMSNGIGATSGILVAGAVVNHWCHWEMVTVGNSGMRLFMGDWIIPWLLFAAYALVIAIGWLLAYKKALSK